VTLDVSQLVPHRGRMCWLDEVTHLDPERRMITCGATVRDDNPLIQHRRLPAWALLELVAQAAAALRGSAAVPERGYLVAVRDATFVAAEIPVGAHLVVEARLVDERGAYRYLEGEVRGTDGATLCRVALSVVLEQGPPRQPAAP
jgi:predicted hotdog family 3-hydroxylacyl-ACP dehydratase